jgi:hypothetical protein
MKCDLWASLLTHTFASPYFVHEPKARVVIISLCGAQILWHFRSEVFTFCEFPLRILKAERGQNPQSFKYRQKLAKVAEFCKL